MYTRSKRLKPSILYARTSTRVCCDIQLVRAFHLQIAFRCIIDSKSRCRMLLRLADCRDRLDPVNSLHLEAQLCTLALFSSLALQSSHRFAPSSTCTNMVVLLDLPSEVLEMVLSVLVKAASPIISTPPCADYDNLKELHAILSLRLVHSRFRTLLDPLIFRQINCAVQHGRDAGGSRSVQKRGLYALLATSPVICSLVKTVNIACKHGMNTR